MYFLCWTLNDTKSNWWGQDDGDQIWKASKILDPAACGLQWTLTENFYVHPQTWQIQFTVQRDVFLKHRVPNHVVKLTLTFTCMSSMTFKFELEWISDLHPSVHKTYNTRPVMDSDTQNMTLFFHLKNNYVFNFWSKVIIVLFFNQHNIYNPIPLLHALELKCLHR